MMAFIGFCLIATPTLALGESDFQYDTRASLALQYNFCKVGLPSLDRREKIVRERSRQCCEQHKLGCDNVEVDVSDCYEKDVNYDVSDADALFVHWPTWKLEECVANCEGFKGCNFFSYDEDSWTCTLKASGGTKITSVGVTSGPMTCGKKTGPEEAWRKKYAKLVHPEDQVEKPFERKFAKLVQPKKQVEEPLERKFAKLAAQAEVSGSDSIRLNRATSVAGDAPVGGLTSQEDEKKNEDEKLPVEGSCARRCTEEEHYDYTKFTCGCYDGCEDWKDCCHDKKEVCDRNDAEKEDLGLAVGSDSCANRCEEEEHYDYLKFTCGCYGGCEDWKDCCLDKKEVCEGNDDTPVLLTSATMGTGEASGGDDVVHPLKSGPNGASRALTLSTWLLFVTFV